jgi:hypothetical protein
MKGSYHFRVKSKKVIFEFDMRRNITVIKGESATGKTTLLHMLYEYLRVGKESGYIVSADVNYYVYLRHEVGRDWKDTLYPLKDTVIFIEENNNFVFGQEFAEFVKNSGNYFVIVNRSPLKMLPYSIQEIYEIVTNKKRADIKESYHELKEIYSNYPILENNKIENIVTEDSNSGYQFFKKIYDKANVVSANGNANIVNKLGEINKGDTLVVADGAAFGAIIENCIEYFKTNTRIRMSMWLPESFEFLILKSGIVHSENLENILVNTSNYVDSEKYCSWERYFTDILVTITKDTMFRYSKNILNEYYLHEKNVKKIMEQFPNEIKRV